MTPSRQKDGENFPKIIPEDFYYWQSLLNLFKIAIDTWYSKSVGDRKRHVFQRSSPAGSQLSVAFVRNRKKKSRLEKEEKKAKRGEKNGCNFIPGE